MKERKKRGGRFDFGNIEITVLEGTLAPCKLDGVVTTVDMDSKDGICKCADRECSVDSKNRTVGEVIITNNN